MQHERAVGKSPTGQQQHPDGNLGIWIVNCLSTRESSLDGIKSLEGKVWIKIFLFWDKRQRGPQDRLSRNQLQREEIPRIFRLN